jgi:ubiquinone biosynthesis protein
MLIKVLVELEGTARLLSPKFNLIEVMRPYQRRMQWRRLSPARQYRKWRRFYADVEHLIRVMPREILELLDQIETGTFDVHLDHRGLEPSVNRLVLGMLASALILGSALLLAHKVPPVVHLPSIGLENLSSWGLTGMVLAFALGLRVWRAISKSGKLEERYRNRNRRQ